MQRSKQATIILPALVIAEEITVVTLLQKAYDNLRVFVQYTGFMAGACMNSDGSGLLVYSYKNNKNIYNVLFTITIS